MNVLELLNHYQIADWISALLALLIVLFGFRTWRLQVVKQRRVKLAEEILLWFKNSVRAIDEIRTPFNNPLDERYATKIGLHKNLCIDKYRKYYDECEIVFHSST